MASWSNPFISCVIWQMEAVRKPSMSWEELGQDFWGSSEQDETHLHLPHPILYPPATSWHWVRPMTPWTLPSEPYGCIRASLIFGACFNWPDFSRFIPSNHLIFFHLLVWTLCTHSTPSPPDSSAEDERWKKERGYSQVFKDDHRKCL
jgi:hypothetical protein